VNRALLPLLLTLPLGCRGTFDINQYIADGESGEMGSSADTLDSATSDASETRTDESTDSNTTDTDTDTNTDTDTDTSTDTDAGCSVEFIEVGLTCIGLRQLLLTGSSTDIEVAQFAGGDQLLDLLVAGAPVTSYDGLPGGMFDVGVPIISANGPRIAAADWNDDGQLDFVAISEQQFSFLLSNGLAGFTAAETHVPGGHDAVFGDFDFDGDLDIVLSGLMLRGYRNDITEIMLSADLANPAEAIAAGDFDGDAYPDLVLAMPSLNQIGVILPQPEWVFPDPISFPLPQVADVAVGTIDGVPGDELLAVGGARDPGVLFLGKVQGAAIMSLGTYPVGNLPKTLAVGDIDGDGFNDVAVGNYASHDVSVLLGADGLLANEIRLPVDNIEDFPQSIAVADLEGDGRAEIVVAMYNSERVLVYGAPPGD
jgi:hypothetical protein